MDGLIELKSDEGQKLLAEVQHNGAHQPFLLAVFCKQVSRSSCGLVSCAHILSARHLGQNGTEKDPNMEIDRSTLPYTEDNMFTYPQTSKAVAPDKVETGGGGMTLNDLNSLLTSHGCKSTMYLASQSSVEEFQTLAKQALAHRDSRSAVIINYHMGTLGQGTFYGHHSPLVAYHQNTDRFLLLDTWPDTEACWATSRDIYNAMNTVDGANGKSRGFSILSE